MDDGDPFAAGGIAVVTEEVPPGGPSTRGSWPSGGGQVASCTSNVGPGWGDGP